MGNKIQIAVIKIRTVRLHKNSATADNDIYPVFADETISYKVYLSDDISADMPAVRSAVKSITDKVETKTLKLTADGPCVDLDDSRRFSKEVSQQAVDLLAAALPQYEFEIAEHANGLKYEINPAENPMPERDVVADRHTAMKYLLGAVVVLSIIPYTPIPWASYAVAFIYSMFAATIVYCLLTWIVSRIVKADKIFVSIGVTPHLCLYRFKSIDIHCGPFPFPDFALPASVMSKYYKSWTIAGIPPVIMTFIGYAFVIYRNYLYESFSDAKAYVLQCPTYSIAALFAVSCFLTAGVALAMYLEKAKDIYTQQAVSFTFMEWVIAFGGVIGICNNFAEIMTFIGI